MDHATDQLWLTVARELARRHAAHLHDLGETRALACDPCPHCCGRVIASEQVATCTSCGWKYREPQIEPLASKRAEG